MSTGIIPNVAFLWKCLVSSFRYYQFDDHVVYLRCTSGELLRDKEVEKM
jgi:hypothetical protein